MEKLYLSRREVIFVSDIIFTWDKYLPFIKCLFFLCWCVSQLTSFFTGFHFLLFNGQKFSLINIKRGSKCIDKMTGVSTNCLCVLQMSNISCFFLAWKLVCNLSIRPFVRPSACRCVCLSSSLSVINSRIAKPRFATKIHFPLRYNIRISLEDILTLSLLNVQSSRDVYISYVCQAFQLLDMWIKSILGNKNDYRKREISRCILATSHYLMQWYFWLVFKCSLIMIMMAVS